MLQEVSEDVKSLFDKNIKTFTETTPEGNVIDGLILLNHGYFHGSLLIENVNGNPALQFVRGFPKIHYFDESKDDEPKSFGWAYEKLDGTCVGMYWLRDANGEIIELVPKSRQRAVLDEHFREMLHYCDTRKVYEENLWNKFSVVYFELYGMLNEHTLPHRNTYIDIRTIGAVHGDRVTLFSPFELSQLSLNICVPLPKRMVDVNYVAKGWESDEEYYNVKLDDPLFEEKVVKLQSFSEVTSFIQKYLDKCNEIYRNEKGYLKYEGVVFQMDLNQITTKYIKVKSSQFQDDFRDDGLSVPVNEIRKEIQKIIKENLSTYEEDYDENEVIRTINEYLAEDYSETDIRNRKTQNVLKKELHKYIESISDKSINKMVDDILQHNIDGDMEIKELMKYFGKHYPMMKHRSRDVYFILSKRLKKGD